MSRICHHWSLSFPLLEVVVVGCVSPVIVGRGASPDEVLDASGMSTRSERHAPRPGTTVVFDEQLALTHCPPFNTLPPSAQLRQLLAPDALQLAQDASQFVQVPCVESKNVPFAQLGTHRPLALTGREGGHVEHWSNPDPLHVAQSGWHAVQEDAEAKEVEGQEETHVPFEASRLLAHVRQKVVVPAQVLHDESQARFTKS